MVFDVFQERAADILADLLELYYSDGCKIVDFTFGTGSLWWKIFETPTLTKKYKVTGLDAVPFSNEKAKAPEGFKVLKKNILKDQYNDIGKYDVGLVDFPYRIGKPSEKSDQPVAVQLMGPRSWAASTGDTSRFMYNESEQSFVDRLKIFNQKAVQCLKPGALLLNKIMNVGDGNGGLAPHAYTCWQFLTNFKLMEDAIYIRHDTGPFRRKGKLERIHGHFQIFKMKDDAAKPRPWENQSVSLEPDVLHNLETIARAKHLPNAASSINWLLAAQGSRRGKDWIKRLES